MDVVGVVDLREVVERAGQLRERQRVLAPLVLDLDEPLLDVDVGRSVLAHRAELHQVAVGDAVADREQEVEGADHVRVLGLDRRARASASSRAPRAARRSGRSPRAASRRPRRRGTRRPRSSPRTARISLPETSRQASTRSVERADRGQRVGRVLDVPAAAGEVVDDGDLVPAGRESHRGRPPQVPVATQDQDAHRAARVADCMALLPDRSGARPILFRPCEPVSPSAAVFPPELTAIRVAGLVAGRR